MKVHEMRDHESVELYDATQSSDDIKDGDVVVGMSAVVILVECWPVIVKGDDDGTFHRLTDGISWEFLDGGKYASAAIAALAIDL